MPKVGEHEAAVIILYNCITEDTIRAINDARDFYGKCSLIEEAKEIDKLDLMWKSNEGEE